VLQLPPRSVIANRYMLGRVAGQGGFGITYIGWDMVNGRKVAVKEFMPQTVATRATGSCLVTPSSQKSRADFEYGLERFSEEARILMLFREHPCIVSFLDFQQANGTAYMIMELLEGMTLADYLRSHDERIPCEQALAIIMLVLDGLREVHAHNLLHRDISPDNIFLTRSKAVKLIDFGASRVAMGERSQNLSVILKPGYAPPEQYQQRGRQGAPTDIYATAATLYRAITGRVPPVSLERQIDDTLKMPSRMHVQVPPNVEAAMRRGLALQMKDRFANVEEFQAALRSTVPCAVMGQQESIRPAPNPFLVYLVGILGTCLLWMVLQRSFKPMPLPNHKFQMLNGVSTESDHLPGSGRHETLALGFCYAHECSVRDGPVIFESSPEHGSLDVPWMASVRRRRTREPKADV
jgi:serine/threonine protein kinase